MTNQTGNYTRIVIGGYDLTTRSSNIALNGGYDEVEVSGYTQDHSTMKGQGFGDATLDGYFSKATGSTHEALSTLSDTATSLSVLFGNNTNPIAGDYAWCLPAQQMAYTHNPDLAATIAVNAVFKAVSIAPEMGRLLADAVVTADDNGLSVDSGAASANGGVGIAHIMGLSAGGTITLKIQDSPDGNTWADLIVFTLDGSSRGAERLEVGGNIDRYLRAGWSVTGSDVNFPIIITFVRR